MRREDAVMLSQQPSLRQYIVLYVLTVGRRLVALRQMLALVLARGESDALRDQILQLIAYDEGLVKRENLWRQQKQQSDTRPDAKNIDPDLDRQLGAVYTAAEKSFVGLSPTKDAKLIADGKSMLDALFPDGVGAIIHLPYDDELTTIQNILSELDTTWLAVVKEIGLTRQVEYLRELTSNFAVALGQMPKLLVDFKTLRAERWLGHELMLGVVAKILGTYCAPEIKAIDSREALLLPIKAQNERVGEYLKRRQRVSDVDPDTGEELEPDSLSEPIERDGALL